MNNKDWSKWSSISEIVSSGAILITLIYLGIQTQQNTDAVQASSRNTLISSDLEVVNILIDNPDIQLSISATEISNIEAIKLENFLFGLLRTREHQWFQYKEGLLDEKSWRSYQTAVGVFMSYSRTRQWWRNVMAAELLDKEFMEQMNEMLESIPVIPAEYNTFF
jgi:hypothetical protein